MELNLPVIRDNTWLQDHGTDKARSEVTMMVAALLVLGARLNEGEDTAYLDERYLKLETGEEFDRLASWFLLPTLEDGMPVKALREAWLDSDLREKHPQRALIEAFQLFIPVYAELRRRSEAAIPLAVFEYKKATAKISFNATEEVKNDLLAKLIEVGDRDRDEK